MPTDAIGAVSTVSTGSAARRPFPVLHIGVPEPFAPGSEQRPPAAALDVRPLGMRDILEAAAVCGEGLIPAAKLRALGIASHGAKALVSRDELVRIRRGMYVPGMHWRSIRPAERYRLFVRATATLAQRPAVVSHMSAAALHRLPTIGEWPATVHLIDTDATGGSHRGLTTRHRHVDASGSLYIDGLAVTSLPRTLVDVASSQSFLVAVTMIDHALRVERERAEAEARRGVLVSPQLTKDDLYAEVARVSPRRGAKQAERAIEFADGLAANPGESMSRVRMFELGFEVPELQVHFFAEGRDYWVDYFWRGIRKIGEFDGKHKYTRGVVLGDRDAGEVVWEEKRREDALRRHANSFTRWDWETAISPRRFYEFLVEQGVPRA